MSPATSLLISHTNASGTIAVSFSYVVTFKRGPERKRQLTSTNKYWYFLAWDDPKAMACEFNTRVSPTSFPNGVFQLVVLVN